MLETVTLAEDVTFAIPVELLMIVAFAAPDEEAEE